ncbi:MAG TPA: cell division protein FtsL [Terriglobales bacterium]|nr:cell division protein FtsL [Terriglobales bacterium]
MAAPALAVGRAVPARRKSCWMGTPEVYFTKPIDNSRVVKVADPQRSRELRMMLGSICCLFLLVMTFAWQHFSAIEYGYKIEALKVQRDGLVEMNRALRLEDASLRDPGRIDTLAKRMGLQSPQAGQVLMMDTALPDSSAPEMARISQFSVVPAR